MKKLFQFLIAVFVIGMLAIGGKMVLDQYPDLLDAVLPNSSKEPENSVALSEKVLSGPYDVVRVVDGDTAIIAINGEDTRVRFIGVDTPESVNPDESKNTPEGKEASDFTKELLTGKTVCLEYDVQLTDDYGRTLAYIYLDDGATMVQTLLLEKGLATTMTVQPNSKYASLFYDTNIVASQFPQYQFILDTFWSYMPPCGDCGIHRYFCDVWCPMGAIWIRCCMPLSTSLDEQNAIRDALESLREQMIT